MEGGIQTFLEHYEKVRARTSRVVDCIPAERLEWTRKRTIQRYGALADRFRDKLVKELGPEKAKAVKTAEAFEICEYGRQPKRRIFASGFRPRR